MLKLKNTHKGILLALTTMSSWAALPIGLKLVLENMDAITISWFRFLVAAILQILWIWSSGRWRTLLVINRRQQLFLLIAAISLCLNYIFYLWSLDRLSPSASQVLIQLAPMLMLCGGIVFFKERLSLHQWIGVALLLCGIVLFFNDRFAEILSLQSSVILGVFWMVNAAIFWAVYALLQKKLLEVLPAEVITTVIYSFGAVCFFYWAKPMALSRLNLTTWCWLVFCALNTVLAYGAFAESLKYLPASRISLILALTPLGTISLVYGLKIIFPLLLKAPELNAVAMLGAFFVVSGSIIGNLKGGRRIKHRNLSSV